MSSEPLTAANEETRLILAAQAGDKSAFTSLVNTYWDRLYRWLVQVTRDSHAAEDLAQETFLKAFSRLDRFTAGSNFRAWIFRIAHNNWVNLQRVNRKQKAELPEELSEWEPGPDQRAQDRDDLRSLLNDVAKLAPDFRAAIMLRAEGELSFKEIGEVMGVPEETARWRVFKARQRLVQMQEERENSKTEK
ncbi:RNA polymerase sigma factor [Telmatocola sphagniphila]|uniref:RNA polymerase sigma factor n=1 Tax=Telmatocola sphagniphila TaxID=1123043 RepID=A0A8E6BAU3_9BACT|nr:RNA polymerase sigma factor [Telmatocola sphagniphila]QVL34619.1 RNA polymerase sigma factor [Telmatocola sphagniphila]